MTSNNTDDLSTPQVDQAQVGVEALNEAANKYWGGCVYPEAPTLRGLFDHLASLGLLSHPSAAGQEPVAWQVLNPDEGWMQTDIPDSYREAGMLVRPLYAAPIQPDALRAMVKAAQAVIERWDTPAWKDVQPTAHVIHRLRDAIKAAPSLPPASSQTPPETLDTVGQASSVRDGERLALARAVIDFCNAVSGSKWRVHDKHVDAVRFATSIIASAEAEPAREMTS